MNKPKTIADLKINWNFNFETYLDYDNFRRDFRNKNHNLKIYNIITNTYFFNLITDNIPRGQIRLNIKDFQIIELMFELDYRIACELFTKPENYFYELVTFVRINDFEYDVILRKVEKNV